MTDPLLLGFKWMDSRGQDKWASIRYERLTDVCYSCGRIGHNSTACTEQPSMDEVNGIPTYDPWISASRPRMNTRWVNIGGSSRNNNTRDLGKKTWREMMKEFPGLSQQGQTPQGDTSTEHTRSQVASNHSAPMPNPDSGERAYHEPDPRSSGSAIKEMSKDRGSSIP